MAKDENTAINDLIARMAHRSITPAVQKSAAQRQADAIGTATLPASPRALALGSAAPPVGAGAIDPGRALATSIADARDGDADGEHLIGTMRLSRPSERRKLIHRLMLPAALVMAAGGLLGAYIAAGSRSKSAQPADAVSVAPSTAATAPPTAATAPPTAATPTAATAPAGIPERRAPALVDVRIDSIPSGATVTLVDRGKTQLVGNTPIAAAIDPARDYDLVFTYAGRPTKIEHLDPRITQRIAVALDAASPATSPPPRSSAPPSPPARARPEPVDAARRPAVEAPAPRKVARAQPVRGEGTLMISSKPPCEIVIDGKPTGLTTPQRAITLPAGRHKVTLINSEKAIERTLTVQIRPDATEKIIEDLMK